MWVELWSLCGEGVETGLCVLGVSLEEKSNRISVNPIRFNSRHPNFRTRRFLLLWTHGRPGYCLWILQLVCPWLVTGLLHERFSRFAVSVSTDWFLTLVPLR